MTHKKQYSPKPQSETETVPFDSAEEAWFWFVQGMQARQDGARFNFGLGLYPRPCEPLDILKAVDRLYRQRRLLRDHLLVLRHYGRRMMPPDRHRQKEQRAHGIWQEALGRLENILTTKGIVRSSSHHYMEAAE